jgi:2-polyprenyl-6-methoxyphenol hydroxylase-like FAD-dependent oxidoreductase
MSDENAAAHRRYHGGSTAAGGTVLVVGAGPTGLLLASELRRRDVPVLLIDSRAEPLHWDRATVVHPRTLQIFDALGVVDELLERGCRQRVIKIHSGGELLGTIDLSTSGSSYGFNLGLSEEVTESVLTAYLHRQGGRVTHGARLVGLAPRADGVRVDIEENGERSQVDVGWVVGCDGIHSATRDLAGIGFEGHPFAKQWAVFDAAVDGWTDTFEGIFAYHDVLPIILTALPGQRWRVYLRPRTDQSDLVADATSTLRRYLPSAAFVDVTNPTRFNCYTKIANRYRSDRVLLAGDSAHLCSPAEGHGMNTGVQDAFNLAWKLSLVVHGAAGAELLDSYEAERRPVAERITRSGDDFEQAQLTNGPAARRARDDGIRAMLADPTQLHRQVMAETELMIDYSDSPIVVQNAVSAEEVGERLTAGFRLPEAIALLGPNAPTPFLHELGDHEAHTVLLIAGPEADDDEFAAVYSALRDRITDSAIVGSVVALATRTIISAGAATVSADAADRLGVTGTTLAAIRPDGYLGLRADQDHVAALESYCTLLQYNRPTGGPE